MKVILSKSSSDYIRDLAKSVGELEAMLSSFNENWEWLTNAQPILDIDELKKSTRRLSATLNKTQSNLSEISFGEGSQTETQENEHGC